MNVLSLFSGIGGIDLGLERAGCSIVGQCEIDEFCRFILATHWPQVPRHDDVHTVLAWWAGTERPGVDIICGGPPCQDFSHAGRRAGTEGQHGGLWAHFAAAVRQLRPRFVLLENTPGLLVRGMGRVVGDLADLGYDAEWECLPAAAFGAPHLRARLWLLAYPDGRGDVAADPVCARWPVPDLCPGWEAEPAVPRMADGVPTRLVRRAFRALGNGAVPVIAEYLGREIQRLEAASREIGSDPQAV